jgi:hypothetical protein
MRMIPSRTMGPLSRPGRFRPGARSPKVSRDSEASTLDTCADRWTAKARRKISSQADMETMIDFAVPHVARRRAIESAPMTRSRRTRSPRTTFSTQ